MKRSNIPREHFQGIDENEHGVTSKRTLILPYAGEKACSIVRYLEKQLKRLLPNNVKQNIVFSGTKLSSNFTVKNPVPYTANFEVIGRGYRNNARRRKIAEALLVKKLKPTLNIQEKSVPLKLFN